MKIRTLSAISAAALMVATAQVQAAEPLKVGVLATLEGTYTVLGEDGVRGLRTALSVMGNEAGG
ncbi:MAG: ABC transporter substrate-binding protein, partial [Pseudomonadota bacterium]